MFSIKEILNSQKLREQEPLNRKVVIGQVSIATDSRRATRSIPAKQQHQSIRKSVEVHKKPAA